MYSNYYNKIIRKNLLFYLTVWIIASLGGIVFFYNIYNSLIDKEISIINELASREIMSANSYSRSILVSTENNLNLISNTQYLKNYIESVQPLQIEDSNEFQQKELAQFLIQLLKINPQYFSIRYIDRDGHERIKVENTRKKQTISPPQDLKDVSEKYYVKECLKSRPDSIYYSKIDLQKTDGKVVFPFKPTLHVCKAIYSHLNELKGIIVINLTVNFYLQQHISMLNENGDWLIGGGENWMNFAFDRPGNFKTDYPKAWSAINSAEFGNIISDNTYFEFTTLRPPSTDEGIKWKIVSQHSIFGETVPAYLIDISPVILMFLLYELAITAFAYISFSRKNKLLNYQHIIETNLEHYDISLKAGRAMSWTYSPVTHTFRFSNHFEFLIGITPDRDFTEEQIMTLFNKSENKNIGEFFDFINSSGSDSVNIEFSLEHKVPLPSKVHNIASGELWLKTYAIKLFDNEDNLQIYGISIDITNRILLEQSSIESRKASEKLSVELQNLLDESERLRIQAEEASSAKADFLANISHEIRTPMNSILGMVSLLERSTLNSEQMDFTHAIKHSGEALLLIINDILDHSKIESGKLDIIEETFNIRQTLDHIISMIKPQLSQSSVKVTHYTSAAIPEYLIGDDLRITQVLLNIAGNAVKFTSSGNIDFEINIINESDDLITLEFRISDTGIGIAPEALDHIFDKFTQADQSTTRKFGGTGLGLSICKSLVELMNGSISVESTLGRSTTFTIILPLKKDHSQTTHLTVDTNSNIDTEELIIHFPSAKILLCEDNEMNQNLCLKFLDKFGTTADIAVNGLIAIDMFTETNYDLIFMDIQMPELSGISATKRIREIEDSQSLPHTPIVAVTANIYENDKQACFDAGMDDFLAKPVSMRDFYRILLKFIPENLQELAQSKNITSKPVQNKTLPVTLTPESTPYSSEGIIDFEAGIANSGGKQTYLTMLGLFINDTLKIVEAISEQANNANQENASRQCHTLKSMAGIVGATKLQKSCLKGEHSTSCEEILSIYPDIQKNATEAISAFEAYLAENSPEDTPAPQKKTVEPDTTPDSTATTPELSSIEPDVDPENNLMIIDVEAGIENSGCEENFYEMLGIFEREISNITQGIEFESLNGNPTETFRHIRTLKNMAHIIGASRLYNNCINAESSKDCYVIQQILPIMKEEIDNVLKEIAEYQN